MLPPKFAAAPTFAGKEDAIVHADTFGVQDEIRRIGGVELEHLVMAGDHATRADIGGKFSGLTGTEIAGNASLWKRSIDGKERDIDLPFAEIFGHARKSDGVAAMVNGPWTKLDDVAKVPAAAFIVFVEGLVRRRDAGEFKIGQGSRFSSVQAQELLCGDPQAISCELPVGFGDHQPQRWIDAKQRFQRLGIEMVGVVMARGDDIDKIQSFRRDYARGHPHVGFIGLRVFGRERIR